MKYQLYQAYCDMLASLRLFTRGAVTATSHPWLTGYPGRRELAAACEVLLSADATHRRPDFGLTCISVGDGKHACEVPVYEEAAHVAPFGTLRHFRKEGITGQPRVLLVAPMSGHFATQLRQTIRTMLADHDVYVTDWHNARDVSLAAGRFGLDDYAQYLLTFLEVMGPGVHIVAICQSCVAALAATAIMAEDDHPAQPRSLTLIGGPIDTRINPTAVNRFATSAPIAWFEKHLIDTVPLCHTGARRRVYPGFMHLMACSTMDLERHVDFFKELYNSLAEGNLEKANAIRAFYEEHFTTMDLTAEFYLETLRDIFQQHALPLGKLKWRDRIVNPASIRRTALLTIEGEHDDVCAIGQTFAAQKLCEHIPRRMRSHHMQSGVGHDGVFRGPQWAEQIYPVVLEKIHVNQ